MVRLKVTAKGQITLKKEVLDHLGISPGDEVDVDLLPEGGGAIRAVGGRRRSRACSACLPTKPTGLIQSKRSTKQLL
ncbi:AbrB/MazE/SpoVT family DNA-binding domain-containing protein [Rhizobium deserti]|uniref:AbrB/MazE/SpoVT family DNA-binding domain-containing protein n=1 Tax=Rhizobium deserti TaxID=2547961 RepID=UPI001FE064BA|nr:AbrB/MazE/SpoVT family DNA-binding domain-containing protein [Rhizobium deserti]